MQYDGIPLFTDTAASEKIDRYATAAGQNHPARRPERMPLVPGSKRGRVRQAKKKQKTLLFSISRCSM